MSKFSEQDTEAGVKKFFNGHWTLNDWAEQDIDRVIAIISPLIDHKDCGNQTHAEVVRRTAILFLKTQSQLAKVASGQQDRFGNEML